MNATTAEVLKELEFLRFFYAVAGTAFGPASGDIYSMIKEGYIEEAGSLPIGYEMEDA